MNVIRCEKSPVYSEEFKEQTTSDASNNKSKLRSRIEFVKNKLLGS